MPRSGMHAYIDTTQKRTRIDPIHGVSKEGVDDAARPVLARRSMQRRARPRVCQGRSEAACESDIS